MWHDWAILYQRWRRLLFLHWEMPIEALRRRVPAGLEIDTFEGRAFAGIVPFTIRGSRPRGVPAIPGLSAFHELNVRTYVRRPGDDAGVWFFSLDAASRAAVAGARAGWRLPYFFAEMAMEGAGDETRYVSHRRWPRPIPAAFEGRYRVLDPIGTAQPGTLEHFLVERYVLYTKWTPLGLMAGRVRHAPYPLYRAQATVDVETMARAAGLPQPTGPPHVLYSPGVDVEIFGLRKAREE